MHKTVHILIKRREEISPVLICRQNAECLQWGTEKIEADTHIRLKTQETKFKSLLPVLSATRRSIMFHK